MEGTIVSIKYGVYVVNCDNVLYNTSPKGSLKHKDKLYVGDRVIVSDDNFVILDVLKRDSLLIRPSISNVSQILLIFSLKEPEFSYYLALKYLTYANYNGIKSSLVLTKSDIGESEEINKIKKDFEQIGIKTYVTCSKNSEGIEEIKELLANKITVLVGQSGVGKSSLLNAINNNYSRDIGEYSLALGRGKHKTKEIVLLPYENGYIADTPGFSSLNLRMNKIDIAHYFPSFEKDALECFYSNCLHISEKNCKIKARVDSGDIPNKIYQNYLTLLDEAEKY